MAVTSRSSGAPVVRSRARQVRFAIDVLFIAAIVVQIYLAGRGIFGASNFEAHKNFGGIIHLLPLVLLIVSAFGRDMRNALDLGLPFGLLVLTTIQFLIASYEHPDLSALHPVNAVLILALVAWLVQRDRGGRTEV